MTRRAHLVSNFALSLSLAAGLFAAGTSASAQSPTRLKATIPFNFSANKAALPAGTYIIERTSADMLLLRNIETEQAKFFMVRLDSGQINRGASRLIFHREAGQTYLTQVWVEGSSLHSELLSHPKPHRELAKLAPPASTFEIAANQVTTK
jgi:hypothetical protein